MNPSSTLPSRPTFRLLCRLLVLFILGGRAAPAAEGSPYGQLQRVGYRHPGLVVDLGVGLWAWPLPMDFDGDGDLDLVVNCPDKPYNGVYFFENPATDTAASERTASSMPVFKAARRISVGLQNVQVSFVDGHPRILSPGREYADFLSTGLARPSTLPLRANVHPNRVRANMWRYVDFDGDDRQDLIVGVGDWTDYGWDNAYDQHGKWTAGPLRGFVYVARNRGSNDRPEYDQPVKVMAGDSPVEVYGWPSPNFADFDGDGDLDLLCGEFLDGFTYFENVGTRTRPRYAPGLRLNTPEGRPLVMDLQMITPTAIDFDDDGDQDLIVGDEDGRVALIENTGRLDPQRRPLFLPPRYFQQEAQDLKCGALATPVGFDWDGDGDVDILSGNTAGYLVFFENLSGPNVETPKWAAPRYLTALAADATQPPVQRGENEVIRIQAGPNGSIQGPCEAKWGYTTLSVADWDGDGLPDLIVNSIWGKVIWYRNVGTPTAPLLAAAQPIEVQWHGPPPTLPHGWLRPEGRALLTQWRTTPVAVDWTQDGLVDLVMLDHEGYLVLFERADRDGQRILLPPKRVFHGTNFSVTDSRHTIVDTRPGPIRLNNGVAGRSGRRKLCIVDFDGDGKLDILVNSTSANLLRQVEARDGHWYFEDAGPLTDDVLAGHDTSPTFVNWRSDTVADLLIGAEDGRFYYLRNPTKR